MTFAASVLEKLSALRAADPDFSVFGAASHRYELNAPCAEQDVRAFETEHDVQLPEDYRAFLLECGNGGAGPSYGLFPLGRWDGAGRELELWPGESGSWGQLREPFPHTQPWNLPDERFQQPADGHADEAAEQAWYDAFDQAYFAPALTNGAMPICHEGCAYRDLLIVTGPQRGRMWIDGRSSDEGIAPLGPVGQDAPTFAAWYLSWLDESLAECGV